LKRC